MEWLMMCWFTKRAFLLGACIWVPALQGMQSDVAFPAEVYAAEEERTESRGAPEL